MRKVVIISIAAVYFSIIFRPTNKEDKKTILCYGDDDTLMCYDELSGCTHHYKFGKSESGETGYILKDITCPKDHK